MEMADTRPVSALDRVKYLWILLQGAGDTVTQGLMPKKGPRDVKWAG